MNPISYEIVENTWKKIGNLPQEEAQASIEAMGEKQPLIVSYLLDTGGELLNQSEREVMLYLGFVIWQIMSQGDPELVQVDEDTLVKVQESNINVLKALETDSANKESDALVTLISQYNQPEILKYIIEALMEDENQKEQLLRDEVKGIMLIVLKSVTDCFDK